MATIVFGLVFVAAYLVLGELLAKKCYYTKEEKSTKAIILHSIASGILLAAVFLEFFRRSYTEGNTILNVCITIVFFSLFYGLTHHVKHSKNPHTVMIAEREVHLLYFLFVLLHYFVIGTIFAFLAQEPPLSVILLGVPLLMVKAVGGLEHIDKTGVKISHNIMVHLAVMMSLLGFFLTYLTPFVDIIFLPALSFVGGAIFHLIITDLFGKIRVDTKYMIIGEIAYGLLVVIPMLLGVAV